MAQKRERGTRGAARQKGQSRWVVPNKQIYYSCRFFTYTLLINYLLLSQLLLRSQLSVRSRLPTVLKPSNVSTRLAAGGEVVPVCAKGCSATGWLLLLDVSEGS